jgi:hypothetical protein
MRKLEPFWLAHRTHFYQRATDNGFSVIGVVGRVFLLNLVLAALAGISVAAPWPIVEVGMLACGVVAVVIVLAQFGRPRATTH